MKSSQFLYMLRYTIQPGHMEEERLSSLAAFCQEARIDDVMFFINGEELNTGHQTLSEVEPWLDIIARGKKLLEPLGVSTSINPWATLLHNTRGRTLRPGQNFRLMVDPNGNQSTAVVCPLCPEWQQYIKQMYAAYAELQPRVLWLEDDFRFHNHPPLDWGGCFCDEHLEEFSRHAGVPRMSREELMSGLLQPGEPHPYRHIWLNSCRETLIELAEEIRQVVHSVSPHTQIGLMTSSPSVHAAEGRDWNQLFSALEGIHPAAIRPCLPAYSESCGFVYWRGFNEISRWTVELIPGNVEIYPELENFTYTLYNKSIAFQKFQLETSLILGAKGITMNIFDMMGNGVYPLEHYGEWLTETKDLLNSVAGLRLQVSQQTGVHVLVNEKSSSTIHTSAGAHMNELYPNEAKWAQLLSAFGIANRFAAEMPQTAGVVAVSGQLFRNMSEQEIRELFAKHVVLLNGDAVFTLYSMGLGSLCGIAQVKWHSQDSGFQAYEQIADGQTYFGMEKARMTAQSSVGSLLSIQYDIPVHIFSNIHHNSGDVVCPGMTLINQRVFIIPYGRGGNDQALYHPVRREIIQKVLQRPGIEQPLMISSYSPHIAVYEYLVADRQTIAIVNTSLDPADGVELTGPTLSMEGWTEYNRMDPMGRSIMLKQTGNRFLLESTLSPLTMTILHRTRNAAISTE